MKKIRSNPRKATKMYVYTYIVVEDYGDKNLTGTLCDIMNAQGMNGWIFCGAMTEKIVDKVGEGDISFSRSHILYTQFFYRKATPLETLRKTYERFKLRLMGVLVRFFDQLPGRPSWIIRQ